MIYETAAAPSKGWVHEAYLRLVHGETGGAWDGRGHFFAAAAEAMRRILIEAARRKRRHKHGGGMKRVGMTMDVADVAAPDDDVLELDTVLRRFAETYPTHARLVELRYFAGLTGEEASHILAISASTADRYWVFARAWLRRELQKGG